MSQGKFSLQSWILWFPNSFFWMTSLPLPGCYSGTIKETSDALSRVSPTGDFNKIPSLGLIWGSKTTTGITHSIQSALHKRSLDLVARKMCTEPWWKTMKRKGCFEMLKFCCWFAFIKHCKSSTAPLPPPMFLSLKNDSVLSWPLFSIALVGFQDFLDHSQT